MTRPIADVVEDDIRAHPGTTVLKCQSRVRFGDSAIYRAFAILCVEGRIERKGGGWRIRLF